MVVKFEIGTAEIAIKAAQTALGSLDAAYQRRSSDADRLVDMGVSPMRLPRRWLIIAQRLARKLCNNCNNPSISR